MAHDVLLYDADCGFCKWTVCRVLAWDREQRLRPVSIQSAKGTELLSDVQPSMRLRSWHLVTGDGAVHSGGAAVAPLLESLPHGSPAARLARLSPRALDAGYRWVARNRGTFGRLTRRWHSRATACVERRAHGHAG